MASATACEEFIDSDYRFEEPFSKTVTLKEAGSFSLENINGSVTITSSPALEVSIKATKYARLRKEDLDKVRIEVVAGEKSVKVDTIYEKRNLRAKVDYEIVVPEGMVLELVRTVNGRITVSGRFEKAVLSTTNGNIKVSGEIRYLKAGTTNGGLDVEQVRGRLELKTTNGSIRVELEELTGDINARATNGSIRLVIKKQPDGYLRARTTNGSIRVEYPVTMEGEISRRRVEGRLGSGQGPQLDLHTTNGSITISRL
ncbi:MAG: DUF4097 family beta strand repeat protein [Candidatus Aminicenantes bacterium]|nr:DUF4097 family beta strand repeat protein [Candidatus Aminicenantes bacterium]